MGQEDWKAEKKKKYGQTRGCGWIMLVIGGIWLGILGLYALGIDIADLSDNEDTVGLMAVVMGTVFLVGLFCAFIPGRQYHKQEKARLNAVKNQTFDESSAWDMHIKQGMAQGRVKAKRANKKAGIAFLIGLAVAILAYYAPLLVEGEEMLEISFPFYMVGGVVAACIAPAIIILKGSFSSLDHEQFKISDEEYRSYIVMSELQKVFAEPVFLPDETFDDNVVLLSGIFGEKVYKCYSDDLLTGLYNGVRFHQADVRTYEQRKERDSTDNDGYTIQGRIYDACVFAGRWISLQSSRPLQSGLYIWSRNFNDVDARKQVKKRGMRPVKMDGAFETLYEVYAYDEMEARRFLTPGLMQGLSGLLQTSSGKAADQGLAMMCAGTAIQVAVSRVDNAFEAPRFQQEMTEGLSRPRTQREIKVLTDVMDILWETIV